MKHIQHNLSQLESLKNEVTSHCMCLYLEETNKNFTVFFPAGFNIGGIRISKGMGKIRALETLLDEMESYWKLPLHHSQHEQKH